MNIIYETTKERGTTVLIPTSMVDSLNPASAPVLAGQAASESGRARSQSRRGCLLHFLPPGQAVLHGNADKLYTDQGLVNILSFSSNALTVGLVLPSGPFTWSFW